MSSGRYKIHSVTHSLRQYLQSPLWQRQQSREPDYVETNRAMPSVKNSSSRVHSAGGRGQYWRSLAENCVGDVGTWSDTPLHSRPTDFLTNTWAKCEHIPRTQPCFDRVTILIQALGEGECNMVTMTIIWCLLGCESRSLTVYRHLAGICSIHPRSRTYSTLKLCKHNCYPTRRCQIPKYTVTFTVAVVRTSPLTLTFKQHVITAYGGIEVKLLSTTWRVNCQLQPPAALSQGKKGFSVLNGQYGNDPRVGLSVM
jgi:hypothetical protein